MPRKGLDILGQKSWHVLRRHNIERVRKDQREERERIEKEKEREDKALFESQIQQLRNKSRVGNDLPKYIAVIIPVSRVIFLFQRIDQFIQNR